VGAPTSQPPHSSLSLLTVLLVLQVAASEADVAAAVASLAVATGHPAAVAASGVGAGALGGTLPILALLPVQLSTAPTTRTSRFLSRPGNTASKRGNAATAQEQTTTPGNALTLLATIRALRMH
jgi:hypothetical protein